MLGEIHIYTDGAVEPNPGRGGWAYVVVKDGKVSEQKSGGVAFTTNNRMEITAVLEAVLGLKGKKQKITIHSDSQYVVNAVNDWMYKWSKKGWRRKKNKEVKNIDLWMAMIDAIARSDNEIILKWVRGHNGNIYNEIADQLSADAISTYAK